MEKRESDKKSSAEWQREEEYLNQTLDIVKRNVENYESEIREMSDQIEEMLQHYHDPSLGFSTIFFESLIYIELLPVSIFAGFFVV